MPDDGDPPARELRRLLAVLSDIELVARLRDEGSVGERRAWLLVRAQVAVLSVRTLHSLLLDDVLNGRTAKLGRPAGLTPAEVSVLRDDGAARETIVHEAVIAGLDVCYRKGILGGGWKPGMASLNTYAVNACLMQIAQQIKRWRRARALPEHPSGAGVDIETDPAFAGGGSPDPAEEVVERPDSDEPLDHLPDHCSDKLREAIRLRLESEGQRKWNDIADEVGMTARALEAALRRLRKWFENNGEGRP